jgi:hypothetical protein
MAQSALKYTAPLSWPLSIPATPRAQQRTDHGFDLNFSIAEAVEYLERELVEFGITGLDVEQPAIERLRKKVGSRTGACLTLKVQGAEYLLTCDRWQNIEHNVYALHLALRQWRNMERWGIGSLHQLLHGFTANKSSAASAGVKSAKSTGTMLWMDALGLGPTATLEDAIAVYHRRAKAIAQDTEALSRLNSIMDDARQYFSKS